MIDYWCEEEERTEFIEKEISLLVKENLGQGYAPDRAIIQLSALSYLAFENHDATPIYLLRNHLTLSFHNLTNFYNTFRNRFRKIHKPQKQIIDYPVLYLALVSGDAALPELKKVLFADDVKFQFRALAYLLIHQINPLHSLSVYSEFRASLNEKELKSFEQLQLYLDIEPWRIQSAIGFIHPRILEERLQSIAKQKNQMTPFD